MFIVAKYWGIQPHVLAHYPLRYYVELRSFYQRSLQSPGEDEGGVGISFDSDQTRALSELSTYGTTSSFTGEAV